MNASSTAVLDTPAPSQASAPPRLGQYWPGQGGIYFGVIRGDEGQPDRHLVRAVDNSPEKLKWAAALDWAKSVEADGHKNFAAPTRFESLLLYVNLRDHFDQDQIYWTGTQYSDDPSYAWCQYFKHGGQGSYHKSREARVAAVRTVQLAA